MKMGPNVGLIIKVFSFFIRLLGSLRRVFHVAVTDDVVERRDEVLLTIREKSSFITSTLFQETFAL